MDSKKVFGISLVVLVCGLKLAVAVMKFHEASPTDGRTWQDAVTALSTQMHSIGESVEQARECDGTDDRLELYERLHQETFALIDKELASADTKESDKALIRAGREKVEAAFQSGVDDVRNRPGTTNPGFCSLQAKDWPAERVKVQKALTFAEKDLVKN